MKIAIISDIHSAYAPFLEAVKDARRQGFDKIILLGDLFTYGVDPVRCSELVHDLIEKYNAIFVGGNHDLIYQESEYGSSKYYESLPDWIKESADWTWNKIGNEWPSFIECVPEWSFQALLLAHANPFGYRDWTYLSNADQLKKAADVCQSRGYKFGVFGHLHRSNFYRSDSVEIHVVGSIGQPRSREDVTPHWAMISYDGETLHLERRRVHFDAKQHCGSIMSEPGLSDATKNRICRYFE